MNSKSYPLPQRLCAKVFQFPQILRNRHEEDALNEYMLIMNMLELHIRLLKNVFNNLSCERKIDSFLAQKRRKNINQ